MINKMNPSQFSKIPNMEQITFSKIDYEMKFNVSKIKKNKKIKSISKNLTTSIKNPLMVTTKLITSKMKPSRSKIISTEIKMLTNKSYLKTTTNNSINSKINLILQLFFFLL